MRQVLRTKNPRGQISQVLSYQAPVGGWNDRDSLANMPPEDAVTLQNWFPTTQDCVVRGGYSNYATVTTDEVVKTLAVHQDLDGTETMFAITDNDCYDVTGGGAGSAATWGSQTNGAYQYTMVGDGTSNWLVMANGVDAPKMYNGSAWTEVTGISTPAITGVTPTTLNTPALIHNTMYFSQTDTLSIWYATISTSPGGAYTEFDLSPFSARGGYIVSIGKWTMDAGDGMDDYAVFLTSEGEVHLYTGIDPGDATWNRKGTYYIGKPIGNRPLVNYGGELLVITQEGIFNMADGLKYASVTDRTAVTDKIKNTFSTSSITYGSTFGWEGIVYPEKNAILFNIPVTTSSQQFVMNTITGAWCNFTGWDAQTFCIYNNELYFGETTNVNKAWTGYADNSGNINAIGQTAFTNFGSTSQLKQIKMFRPMLRTNAALTFNADIEVDFDDNAFVASGSSSTVAGSVWDTGTWDNATWGGGLETIRNWLSPSLETGYYFSSRIKIDTNTAIVRWIANDYLYETGGIL